MAIEVDPGNNETGALFDLLDFSDRRVLEIGCGDGRLTRRYAAQAAHVTAIDPYAKSIGRARADLPAALRDHVNFLATSFEEFAATVVPPAFDTAFLSWSL